VPILNAFKSSFSSTQYILAKCLQSTIPLIFSRLLFLSIFDLVWFRFVSLTNFCVYIQSETKVFFVCYLVLGCFRGSWLEGKLWRDRDRTVKQCDGEWRWNNTGKCSWDLGSGEWKEKGGGGRWVGESLFRKYIPTARQFKLKYSTPVVHSSNFRKSERQRQNARWTRWRCTQRWAKPPFCLFSSGPSPWGWAIWSLVFGVHSF